MPNSSDNLYSYIAYAAILVIVFLILKSPKKK